jgi:hypothetical protein
MFRKKPIPAPKTFPDAPMTDEQAFVIVQECLHALKDHHWISFPQSCLPSGGFPAVVEALARYDVSNPLKQDPLALQAWAEAGIQMFCGAVPDQIFALAERMGAMDVEQRGSIDPGVFRAMMLADSVARAIRERQAEEGEKVFRKRVEELGGRLLDTSGVSVSVDAGGKMVAKR